MDPSILISWKSPFPIVYFFSFILFEIEIPVSKQCRPSSDADLRRLIWVYTVCLDPKNGTLGIKGLRQVRFRATLGPCQEKGIFCITLLSNIAGT